MLQTWRFYLAALRVYPKKFSQIFYRNPPEREKTWYTNFFLAKKFAPKFFHFSQKEKNSGTQKFFGNKNTVARSKEKKPGTQNFFLGKKFCPKVFPLQPEREKLWYTKISWKKKYPGRKRKNLVHKIFEREKTWYTKLFLAKKICPKVFQLQPEREKLWYTKISNFPIWILISQNRGAF